MSKIVIENPEEIKEKILGQTLLEFEMLTKEKHQKDSLNEEPFCADQEILMEFTNGKEIRIYINKEGNLCVYSD